MASDAGTVEFIVDQVGLTGLTYKKMFGEYGLYLQGTFVALVCDNQLFVKPTPEGAALLPTGRTGSPYPNAKPHLLIDEQIDDGEFVATLLRVTQASLTKRASANKPPAQKLKSAAKKPSATRGNAKPAKKPAVATQKRR